MLVMPHGGCTKLRGFTHHAQARFARIVDWRCRSQQRNEVTLNAPSKEGARGLGAQPQQAWKWTRGRPFPLLAQIDSVSTATQRQLC